MAIKGNGYVKTTWAFEERPVTSAKLNTWDDNIEASLELLMFLLSHAWGGGNGVVRGAATNDLKVVAAAVPGLAVEVEPGYAFIANAPYKVATKTSSAAVTVPALNPRIDLVVAKLENWEVLIKPGVEAASPTAPAPDVETIALAELYLRPGMTVIKDTDDGANGYIVDTRTFL
jgi:hypothetical protein